MVFRKSLEDVELNGMQIFFMLTRADVYISSVMIVDTYHLTIK